MEKPYRIEDEKDLADTRYRWQYRAGIILREKQRRARVYKALRCFLRLKTRLLFLIRLWKPGVFLLHPVFTGREVSIMAQVWWRPVITRNIVTVRNQPSVSDDRREVCFGQDSLCWSCLWPGRIVQDHLTWRPVILRVRGLQRHQSGIRARFRTFAP